MSCTTLIASGPTQGPDDYFAGAGYTDPTSPSGCTALSVTGDLLLDQTFYEAPQEAPGALLYFLLIEGGHFLLVSNADGVAGTADDYKLFLF